MIKFWKLRPPVPYASTLARETGLSPLEAQLLINRGLSDTASAKSFLSPTLSQLSNPMQLKDMEEAVEILSLAIDRREKMTIYGDYDADGITGTALLLNFFSDLGLDVSSYIPSRFREGYGLDLGALEKIAQGGTGVMITVDCGSTNSREIARAIELGMKVVVTDHHQMEGALSPICPVVNPHRTGSTFPFKDLAGVGVAFLLAVAVRAVLRERGWFRNRPEPDLRDYLDLVALGTVADMVPLLDQNRIMVSAGLERMRHTKWPGIQALQEITDLGSTPITANDLAFKMAPRLNAPGRMGTAEIGIRMLTTNRIDVARELATQLNALNSRRQDIERGILEQIDEIMATMGNLEGRRTLLFSGHDWHRGVLGIVASRLVNKYHRPALVMDVRDGMATGSARSIAGFNLYKALSRLGHLFERFGGHDLAAGFTLKESCIEALADQLEALAGEELNADDLIPIIEIDAEISLPELTLEVVTRLKSMGPFGRGNPEPLLYCHDLKVMESRVVGERHLKLLLRQGSSVVEAIGFGLGEKRPPMNRGVDLVFVPEVDRWQGYERVQLRMVDLEVTGPTSRLLKSDHSLKIRAAASMSSGEKTKRDFFSPAMAEP
ncbi:MAG: single-stranded-DNA-specific exonuclease RecJ [Pseudomonadota bacterium]